MRFRPLKISLISGCFVASLALAAEYEVTTSGTATGAGTLLSPLSLSKALSLTSPAKPGDTIWLHGGTYQGSFTSSLTGQPDRPIIVRQVPGERATLDCTNASTIVLTVTGAHVWYWGFEVMNSSTDRGVPRGGGIYAYGPENKFINLIVHDTGNGIAFWNHETPATNEEIYGCLIYNGGWQGPSPDRGHGHAIYAQNDEGTKLIRDNIMFSQFGWGVHAYTEAGFINGFNIEGNVSFNHGIHQREGTLNDNYFVGGYQPANRITLRQNMSYNGGIRLGFHAANNAIEVSNNYFAKGNFAFRWWKNLTITDNIFIPSVSIKMNRMGMDNCVMDRNTYHWSYTNNANVTALYHFENENYYTFTNPPSPDWQSKLQDIGYELNGTLVTNSPTGTQSFIRTNIYEPGRANITVFNWGLSDKVDVDMGGALAVGTRYVVRNAQNFFGPIVSSGRYDGNSILLPMTNLISVKALGTQNPPFSTGPQFNVFVLLPSTRAITPPANLRILAR